MTNLKVLEEKKNPLFKRTEIVAEVSSEKTLSFSEAEKIIAEKYSQDPEKVKIRRINGKFGAREFIIEAMIYQNKGDKEKIEKKPKPKKAKA